MEEGGQETKKVGTGKEEKKLWSKGFHSSVPLALGNIHADTHPYQWSMMNKSKVHIWDSKHGELNARALAYKRAWTISLSTKKCKTNNQIANSL